MEKMPTDRAKRWDSIFRRYGIADDSEPDTDKNEPERFEGVKKQLKKALLPDDFASRPAKRP